MGMGAVPGRAEGMGGAGWALEKAGLGKETGKVMEGAVPIRGPEGPANQPSVACSSHARRKLVIGQLLWKRFVKPITGTDYFKLTEGGLD